MPVLLSYLHTYVGNNTYTSNTGITSTQWGLVPILNTIRHHLIRTSILVISLATSNQGIYQQLTYLLTYLLTYFLPSFLTSFLPPFLLSVIHIHITRLYSHLISFHSSVYYSFVSLRVGIKSWYENIGKHQRLLILLPSLKQLTLDPLSKEYDFQMNDRLIIMRLSFFYDKGSFWAPARRIDGNSFNLNEYLWIPTLRKVLFDYVEHRFYHKAIHTTKSSSSTVIDLRFTDWHP